MAGLVLSDDRCKKKALSTVAGLVLLDDRCKKKALSTVAGLVLSDDRCKKSIKYSGWIGLVGR